jgi:hypothetical protein
MSVRIRAVGGHLLRANAILESFDRLGAQPSKERSLDMSKYFSPARIARRNFLKTGIAAAAGLAVGNAVIRPRRLDACPAGSLYSGQVSQSSDDASQSSNGLVFLTTTLINLSAGGGWRGFRWQNVNIAQGATITSATFSPYFKYSNNSGVATIYGEADNNAGTFTTAKGSVGGRSKTSHSVSWDTTPVTGTGFQGSPDLTAIIQEIINRPGWQSGNALALLVSCEFDTNPDEADIYTYDESYLDAACLSIS